MNKLEEEILKQLNLTEEEMKQRMDDFKRIGKEREKICREKGCNLVYLFPENRGVSMYKVHLCKRCGEMVTSYDHQGTIEYIQALNTPTTI